jgi:endo-1,4-beta-xylanase
MPGSAQMNSRVGRRSFIKSMGYLGAGALITGRINIPLSAMVQNIDALAADTSPLRKRAAARGLFYGAASSKRILSSDIGFEKKFAQECLMVVPEWELKWKALRPAATDFNFDSFDWLVNFTQKNKMLFRGHNLVWHEALPAWFESTVNKRNAEHFLLDHIKTVVSRHAGKVHSWDVVNEPVAVWDKNPNGLRSSSPWYKLLGPGYIDIAFHAAAEADPETMLVLNQNRVEQERHGDDETRKALLRLLKRMKSSGTPIHALGIEAHLGGKDVGFNKNKFRAFLSDVAGLDLKIIITELDVRDDNLPQEVNKRDEIIAGIYEDFLSVALDEKAVIGILTWGLSDKYTWLTDYAPRDDKMPVRPLPLDGNFNRKPAWEAIARCFDDAPKREVDSYGL